MALDINALYQANLGRAPDPEGLAYWTGLLNSGTSTNDVLNAFYAGAAKEVQGSTAGLSSATSSWDTNRIIDSMKNYDYIDDLGGPTFWQNAGDTRTTSAAERLSGLPSNYFSAPSTIGGSATVNPAPSPTPALLPAPQTSQNLGMSQFGNPTKYDQKNPYLQQMSDSIKSQMTENLNRNILPGIGSAAIATGGYGGSRQGVVEANALKDTNTATANALTGMYFGDYNAALGRQLSKYGMDQGFYTAQRGQDLAQTQLGANLFQMGTQGMLGQGQGIYNLGLTAQQAPWQTMTGFTNTSNPYTGYGSATQNQTGSGAAGFLGGALAGNQLYNIWSGKANQTA